MKKKTVDILKAYIDFPSNDSLRVTTPYRQRTFKVSSRHYFDLEKLIEIKPDVRNKIVLPDFYLIVCKDADNGSPSKMFYYEAHATISDGHKDAIDAFWHHEVKKLEVKISRG